MPDPQNRSAAVPRNAIFSILTWSLPLGLSLIVTPILIGELGNISFGLYALVLGFIGYSFTFGIGKAAGKYVAQFKASGDRAAISEAVTAVLLLSTILGTTAAAVFFIFSKTIVRDLLLIPEDQLETATVSLQLAGFVILFTMVNLVYQNVLQGIQRFDRLALLTNSGAVVLNAGAAMIAVLTGSVILLVLWNLITVAVMAAIFYLSAKADLPELRIVYPIRPEIRQKILAYSGSIVLYQVAGNLLFIFERALIVRELGSAALTFYAVPLSLAVHFLGFASGVSLAVFPAANSMLDDKESSLRLYRTSTKLLAGASAFFFLGAFLFGQQFLRLWLGSEFADRSYMILVFHAATFTVMGITIIAWQFTESNERSGINALFTAISSVTAAVLMMLLYRYHGSEGIAFSRFAGSLLMLFLIVVFERYVFGKIDLPLWVSISIKLFVAAIAAGSIAHVLSLFMPIGWLTLIAKALFSLVVFCCVLLILRYFDQRETQVFKGLATQLFYRGRGI